jgi:hypothetical protein
MWMMSATNNTHVADNAIVLLVFSNSTATDAARLSVINAYAVASWRTFIPWNLDVDIYVSGELGPIYISLFDHALPLVFHRKMVYI